MFLKGEKKFKKMFFFLQFGGVAKMAIIVKLM
jgi:hypothetical protein